MFKVLDGATAPTRATKYSAMVDLYAREDVVIGAGETKIVPLGVKIDKGSIKDSLEDWEHIGGFMESHYIELHPRSSIRAKGLIVGVGVIDLDYPDEIGLIVHNPIANDIKHNSNGDYTINKGDKIAQCTLKEHKGYLMGIESDAERTGGFGSTN
ncbi:MAG: hypothetical protein ACMV1B_05805 [Prevotella sp.]